MAIDPALKGTTFAAALEAAERAEDAKRAARAAEQNGLTHRSRELAQMLRGYPGAAVTPPLPAPIIQNEETTMTDTPKITTMRDLLEALSDDAWQKPPQGVDPAMRKLAFSNGWVEATGQTSARQWHITPEGFGELERLRTGEPPANNQVFRVIEDAINLDDPALRDDRRAETRWEEIAAERQRKIVELNKTLDDMGKVADDLQAKLNAGGAAPIPNEDGTDYEMLRNMSSAIEELMMQDEQQLSVIEYVEQLRQAYFNENAIVNDINALAAADGKGHMDPRDYVQMLRERTQGTTTGIDWYSVVIAPLLDLMARYEGDEVRLHVEGDPDRIARWASTMRQSLSNMDDIADERAKEIQTLHGRLQAHEAGGITVRLIIDAVCDVMDKDGSTSAIPVYIADLHKKAQMSDQHETTIESLRRCVEEMQMAVSEWQRRAQATDQTQRAAYILNELCSYLPSVEEYRQHREQSLKVIDSLTQS